MAHDFESSNSPSIKDRTNASIAYFFLAPLFLLSRGNSPFAHPFVRSHSKAATKILVVFAILYFLYSSYLVPFLGFEVPFILLSCSRLVSAGIFVAFFFLIIRGAYRAHTGKEAISSIRHGLSMNGEDITIQSEGMNDTQKSLLILSFFPGIGAVIAVKHPNLIHSIGAKTGGWFAVLYIALFVFHHDVSIMTLSLIYAGLVAYIGMSIFTSSVFPLSSILSSLPSMTEVSVLLRALPKYIAQMVGVIFGRKDTLSFASCVEAIELQDRAFLEVMEQNFPKESSGLSPFLIALPVVNLLFLPRILSSRAYRYTIAAGQGIVVSILAILIGYYFGASSSYQMILLIPIALLFANSESHPFYRIPLIYELYSLFGIITFGLTNRARQVHSISKEEKSVSYKV